VTVHAANCKWRFTVFFVVKEEIATPMVNGGNITKIETLWGH